MSRGNHQPCGSPILYADKPSRYYNRESQWKDFRHYCSGQLPSSVRSWLLDRGSLTRRLIRSSKGDFKVIIVSQSWQRPRHSEARLLGMKPREQAIVREVLLLCANQPWVFARSVIPSSTIKGRLRRLSKFDNSPLGEMLFQDPSMRRHPFEITQMEGDSYQLPTQLRQLQPLWGRRCRFELAGKPIMVSEIFLPNFVP